MNVSKLIWLVLILVTQYGMAQSSFHRTYPSFRDKDVVCISSTQMKDGNYVALEMEVEYDLDNNPYSDTFIVTSYKPKGDINWTRAFALEPTYAGNIPALGSIVQGDNDSLYFSFISESPNQPNKIMGSLTKGGGNGWLRAYTSIPGKPDGDEQVSHLTANFNRSLYTGHIGGDTVESSIFLSRKNYSGNNLWTSLLHAKNNTGDDVSEVLSHLSAEADSTLLLSGIVDSTDVKSFIAVTDTLGKIKWSRQYRDIEALIGFPIAYDAARLPDSTYILGGFSVELTAGFNFSFKGFLIKTDKQGNVDWGKKVIFNEDDITTVKHIALDKDNDILVAGVNFDAGLQEAYNFVMKIRKNGTVIWKKKYPRVGGTFDFTGSLFGTKDGGSALITSVTETGRIKPSFIKLDDNGKTTCEENIDEQILFDNSYEADTLIWQSKSPVAETKNVNFTAQGYAYDVPVVTLDVRPFCPEEPIDWTFHAATKGATYYKWSTGLEGANKDSLRVFEEGKYSVTVTIGEQVCFMLCDTSEITRYSKPQIQVGLRLGNFCTNGKQSLFIGYNPGHPQVKSINWSTGDKDVNTIEISSPGVYKVTLVDGCDEQATGEITVPAFPQIITQATISGDAAFSCLSGFVTGALSARGNSTESALGEERFKWSTGATTRAITINDNSTLTYTVTVTDGCGNTASATKTFAKTGPGISSVKIDVDKSTICTNGLVRLNAIADKSGSLSYAWSTNQNTPFIQVDKTGNYSVTVTDLCGNSATASAAIGENELTPQPVEYAHVFFPDGIPQTSSQQDTSSLAFKSLYLNRTFGPINKTEYCLGQITNYEFYVFNRWGQKVFESSRIEDEWDGRIGEKDAQGDTYVWVARYRILGFEKTVKGDVTMIRR